MTPPRTESADDPALVARLDRQAAQIVVENAANSPASIAARYEDTYIRNGWAAHGEMPQAVRNARTDVDTLIASDESRYQRRADGEWVSTGLIYNSTASGNLREELDATRAVLEARLPPPREIPPVPPMDADARLRDTVAGAYRNAGVDVSAEQVAVAATAVRATWDANGLDPATTALQARPQSDGRSELASLRLDTDGKTYVIAAVTTPEDIERARTGVTTAPHANEHASEHASEHGRADSMAMAASSTPLPARMPGGFTPDPRDADNPDNRLYAQIERGVANIDAERGRTFDATSERLAMAAFCDAKTACIASADHLAINETGKRQQDGAQIAAGTQLFVVQGQDPSDPAARRSVTDVAQAIERPVEQSLQKVDMLTQQQVQVLAQQQTQPAQDESVRAQRMG